MVADAEDAQTKKKMKSPTKRDDWSLDDDDDEKRGTSIWAMDVLGRRRGR